MKKIIISGSTKSGTTALYKYLERHPDVETPFTKETRYFLDPIYPLPRTNYNSSEGFADLFENTQKVLCELRQTTYIH